MNKYQQYEQAKKKLRGFKLSPDVYEGIVQLIAELLKL